MSADKDLISVQQARDLVEGAHRAQAEAAYPDRWKAAHHLCVRSSHPQRRHETGRQYAPLSGGVRAGAEGLGEIFRLPGGPGVADVSGAHAGRQEKRGELPAG